MTHRRVEMQCGDVRKYHEKTAIQKSNKELKARKKRVLEYVPEEVVNDSSFSTKRLKKSKK